MTQPVKITADRTIAASGGLEWPEAGAVVEVHDHQVARELLAMPMFSEVTPEGEHPMIAGGDGRGVITEPDPADITSAGTTEVPGATDGDPAGDPPAPVVTDPPTGRHEDNDGDGKADQGKTSTTKTTTGKKTAVTE